MPVTATPRASTRTKPAATPQGIPAPRVTRLRAAKDGGGAASPAAATAPSSLGVRPGLLAKSKEGFRKVSDKLKEKEAVKTKVAAAVAAAARPRVDDNSTCEQLQSYLRIRPQLEAESGTPYLELQDDKSVLMRPPPETRMHTPKPPHLYSFDRVFGPDTAQGDFFNTTTKPLVEKLLHGENGLLFAYGVSNSGKTYTIQGGRSAVIEERGVLPRSVDVVFNSIKGLESKANLKCQGLADVVLTDQDDGIDLSYLPTEEEARLDDSVKVDRNFSYAVFVSYVEVYNDKIFDLLDSVLPSTRPKVAPQLSRKMSSMGFSSHLGSTMSLAALANGGSGVLKRHALVLKNDPDGNGKYIAGVHEIRVRTREEALAVFRCGQGARQVFGTMANRESSRSHGIFTLKVVRVHNGAPEDPDSAQVSRLAIVDLAGSERARNTATTGERLKEAGNINKSLMVLGQCLEVLRSNQQRLATPGPANVGKRPTPVPFRHSKLTEIFQNFFVGDGRAVMMIHINPYDTGFDENSHVMKFSAIAREIQTTAKDKSAIPTLKRQISSHFSAFRSAMGGGQKVKVMVPVMNQPPNATPKPSRVSTATPASKPTPASASASRAVSRQPTPHQDIKLVEEELEIVEEDADDDGSEDERDMLVEYLFEQLRDLKTQLFESEMRGAQIEAEIREDAARELEECIASMRAEFNKRIVSQMTAAEAKADMKLDIVQRTLGAESEMSYDDSFASALEGDETIDSADLSTMSDPFLASPARRGRVSDIPSEREVENQIDLADTSVEDDETEEGESFETSEEEEEEPIELHPDSPAAQGPASSGSSGPTSSSSSNTVSLSPSYKPSTASADYSGEIDSVAGLDDDAVESDDEGTVEGNSFVSDDVGVEGDEEEGEDDDEEEDEQLEESDDDDDDDDDFDASFASTASSESIPEPALRRRTVTPRKTATPRKSTVAKEKMTPLRESVRQSKVHVPYNEDEDLVKEVNTPAKAKKKRTLGKRVVTEDEMEARDAPTPGAEVRRMIRGL